MVEFFFICGILGFLFLVLQHLISKAAYKRKIARSNAESQSRLAEIVRQRSENNNYYETATNEWRKTESLQKREPPPTRKHAKPEIDKFLDVKKKTKIIVFDLETNGFNGNDSVLSCAAIKIEIDPVTHEIKEMECFERYYFPVEKYNPSAIAVNGLTQEAIANHRGDCDYPPHFSNDDGFVKFCEGVNRYVAHNVSFDTRFVPHISKKKKFCTMMANMDIVATQYLEYKNQWKWPTLSETARHYGISFGNEGLHKSVNDTRITVSIFKKMLEATSLDTGEQGT